MKIFFCFKCKEFCARYIKTGSKSQHTGLTVAVLALIALIGVLEILAPAEVDNRELAVVALEDVAAKSAAAKPTLLTRSFNGDLALNSEIVRLFKPVEVDKFKTDDLELGVVDIYEHRGLLIGPAVRLIGEVEEAGVEQAFGYPTAPFTNKGVVGTLLVFELL